MDSTISPLTVFCKQRSQCFALRLQVRLGMHQPFGELPALVAIHAMWIFFAVVQNHNDRRWIKRPIQPQVPDSLAASKIPGYKLLKRVLIHVVTPLVDCWARILDASDNHAPREAEGS